MIDFDYTKQFSLDAGKTHLKKNEFDMCIVHRKEQKKNESNRWHSEIHFSSML